MRNIKVIIKILPLIILIILSILLTTGRVRFGLGLGDIVFHGYIYLGTIIYGIYYFLKKEKSNQISLIFPILSIMFCTYFILHMTIWRGVESRWDGNILTSTHKTKKKISK